MDTLRYPGDTMKTLKDDILKEFRDTDERLGLVLGGGGAKGCYEIGALQAFKECGIHFDCVAGTSIGAIVGSVYACGKDDNLVEFVIDLKPTDIVEDLVIPESFSHAIKHSDSLFRVAEHYGKSKGVDVTPLKNKLDEMFDFDAFEKSNIDYACMTYNASKIKAIPWYKGKGITRENANDVIIASASCFPAFPMQPIDGDLYIDGGYDDNLPVDLALTMNAQKILAIDVKGVGLYKPLIEQKNICYWEPLVPLGNFLDFRAKEGMRSMSLGYLETMKRLDQFPGYVYTFYPEDFRKMIDFENFMEVYTDRFNVTLTKDVKKRFLGKDLPDLRSKYTRLFIYEIVLEHLAFMAHVDPSHRYRFDEFLEEVMNTLNPKKSFFDFNFHKSPDKLVDEGTLDIVRALYNGLETRIPKAFREIDFIEDFIGCAAVWKGLEAFLKK